ncbi:MAG: molybdopterin cofactor-binding domain-containing protein [Actinomycetota bacterium]
MGEAVGRSIRRVNDPDLLTGRTRFLDDLGGDAWAVVIVRSQVAHGVVRSVTTAGPLPHGATLVGPEVWCGLPGRVPVLWTLGDQHQCSVPLWDGTVRYVGQPVAVVAAPTAADAQDAAEHVVVDVEPLPELVEPTDALAARAPALWPDIGSNVLCDFTSGSARPDVEAVLDDCDEQLTTTLRMGRLAGVPMEPRGLTVDPVGGLTITTSTQAPHAVRDQLAALLDRSRHSIRVRAPAVGGGFGIKDHPHDDELMVVVAALHLGRPLHWPENRRESLLASCQARGEVHEATVGFDRDGRLRALWVDAVRDAGAHLAIFGGGPLFAGLGLMPGPYRWEAYGARGRCVATNRVPTAAYRGFGQTQAAFVRERLVDLVAAELGADPVELRARNMVPAEAHPWAFGTGLVSDNGDWPRALRRATELAGAWPDGPDDGRRRGVGVCSYVQMAGLGPSGANAAIGLSIGGFESADVRMEPDGSVRVVTGVTPHGQGQETSFAQLVADRVGVGVDRVDLLHSDTDHTPYSAYGTAASRSMAVGGAALVEAADDLAATLREHAAHRLEADPLDMEIVAGEVRVRGGGGAVAIETLADAAWRGIDLPPGARPGLRAASTYDPASCTFSYGTHVCRVAVDPETGAVEIERYAVVMDCGTVVNPMIVEGQIHGGIAQGAAAALLEEAVVDAAGQPLTSTLLDYLVPDATFLPEIEVERFELPSPHTPGGMKGMGEGGTNGAFGCVVNAVAAALPEIAGQVVQTPVSPQRIVTWWNRREDVT